MRRRLAGLAAVLSAAMGLLALNPAVAQEPMADASIAPDGPLTVGDVIEVRIAVSHATGDVVQLEGVIQLGELESAAAVLREASPTMTLVVLQTRATRSGRFEVALPNISVRRVDGDVAVLSLPTQTVTIDTVLTPDSQPRPLTAPDLLAGGERNFAPWIVALIGIGAGFVLARLVRRRARRTSPSSSADSAETPSTDSPALASFAMDTSLSADDQCRQLAAAVRSRLAEEWSLPAAALTSSEIGPALASAGAPGGVVLRVTRLLEACDRAIYGGEQPAPERLSGYQQQAEAIWSEGVEAPAAEVSAEATAESEASHED